MFKRNTIKIEKPKIKIKVVTYKIPVDSSYQENFDPLVELKPDMVSRSEEMELETAFKLNEVATDVRNYNERQTLMSRKLESKFISQRRIVKA